MPTGTLLAFSYDADGRRVGQSVNGALTTNFIWDEASAYGDVVLETDATGAQLASYTLAEGELLSQSRGGTVSHSLPDAQGSPRALVNATGTVTDRTRYDAYGQTVERTGTTTNPYGYTGQQTDALTGLLSLRARYYDPSAGRFLSRDTYPLDSRNPVEANRYGYAAANPVTFVDPSGNFLLERGALASPAAFLAAAVISRPPSQVGRMLADIIVVLAMINLLLDPPWDQLRLDVDERDAPCNRAACQQYKLQLAAAGKSRLAKGSGSSLSYQIRVAGPIEYDVGVGGETAWADGIDCDTCSILDAKLASPIGPYVNPLNPIRARVTERTNEQFSLYRQAILVGTPQRTLVGLAVLTNTVLAHPFFNARIAETMVPNGRCVTRR